MKKIIILTSLLAAFAMANAQTTYHVVYIPGDGERQFGFSLAPSFCGQHLNVNTRYGGDYTGSSYTSENTVNNYVGFNAGLFYGYETAWGNFIEWGNYASLYYGVNPFSGNVDIPHNGATEHHDIQYTIQHVTLHVNPFISHHFNDQFSISAGIGISLSPTLPSKIKFDGKVMGKNQDMDEFLFTSILNFNFDANIGVKYWMTDKWYVGLRVEYAFANILDIFGKDKETDDILAIAMATSPSTWTIIPPRVLSSARDTSRLSSPSATPGSKGACHSDGGAATLSHIKASSKMDRLNQSKTCPLDFSKTCPLDFLILKKYFTDKIFLLFLQIGFCCRDINYNVEIERLKFKV